MLLPEPDQTILCRRDEIISALKRFLPAGAVIDDDTTMVPMTRMACLHTETSLWWLFFRKPRNRLRL